MAKSIVRSFRIQPETMKKLEEIKERKKLDNLNMAMHEVVNDYHEYLINKPIIITLKKLYDLFKDVY